MFVVELATAAWTAARDLASLTMIPLVPRRQAKQLFQPLENYSAYYFPVNAPINDSVAFTRASFGKAFRL